MHPFKEIFLDIFGGVFLKKIEILNNFQKFNYQ